MSPIRHSIASALLKMKACGAIDHGIMLIMILYPVFVLTVKGGLSGLFLVLVVLSALTLLIDRDLPRAAPNDPAIFFFYAAMISLLAATIASQIYHGSFVISYWDSPSRFLLAIPVYMALVRRGMRVIGPLQYGLPLGAILALITAQALQNHQVSIFGPRITNTFLNPIHFGDLSLMLGMLSIVSINWIKTDSVKLAIFKTAGFVAGIYASLLSGTRGGWLAIPIMFFIWILIDSKNNKRKLAISACIWAVLFLAAYFLAAPFQQRINDSASEIVLMSQGDFDSSLGQRLQIWKAAFKMFLENPVFGVGPEGFAPAVHALGESGYISTAAAESGVNEVHSQPFSGAARLGLLGLLSYVMVHFVPLGLFYRAMKSKIPVTRKSGLMGAFLVTGFIVFGLTVEMYNLKMVATFYSLSVAVLLAAAVSSSAEHPASGAISNASKGNHVEPS